MTLTTQAYIIWSDGSFRLWQVPWDFQTEGDMSIHQAIQHILVENKTCLDDISPAISVLQKGVEKMQMRQEALQNQLLIYWIQLQTLQCQGALCSENHWALTREHQHIAKAMLQLIQYLGKVNYHIKSSLLIAMMNIGTFPKPTPQGHGWQWTTSSLW